MSEINRLATELKKAGVPLHLVEKLKRVSAPQVIEKTVVEYTDNAKNEVQQLARANQLIAQEKLRLQQENDRLKIDLAEAQNRNDILRRRLIASMAGFTVAAFAQIADANAFLAGCDCVDTAKLLANLELVKDGRFDLAPFGLSATVPVDPQVAEFLGNLCCTLPVDPAERWTRVANLREISIAEIAKFAQSEADRKATEV